VAQGHGLISHTATSSGYERRVITRLVVTTITTVQNMSQNIGVPPTWLDAFADPDQILKIVALAK
jgi:hypothetical protein